MASPWHAEMMVMPATAKSPPRWQQIDPSWAWTAYQPSADRPWNHAQAAHLWRRAGFAASWAQLQQAVDEGCPATIDRLIAGDAGSDSFYGEMQATAPALLATGERRDLPAWWLYACIHSPHPLLEKMTLFWHGHFATSAAKVTNARLMFRQHELLRRHALGSFRPLLAGIARDPAMLLWLDSATNRKARPNENFAREVMELFCLGLGNYTEADIQQAARAFTGWEVRQNEFRLNTWQHDDGEKTLFGQRGRLTGDDVLKLLFEQPATATFLTAKIARWLISDTLPLSGPEFPDRLIEPLADGLRQRDYDMGWLVETILRSNLLHSELATAQKVKGPVDYAVGLIRALEGSANCYPLVDDLAALGQSLFYPPNVAGWPGGADWINSATLVGRANLAWALASGDDPRYEDRIDVERLAALDGISAGADEVLRLIELLLPIKPPNEVLVPLAALAGGNDPPRRRRARLLQAIVTLPEFQLA